VKSDVFGHVLRAETMVVGVEDDIGVSADGVDVFSSAGVARECVWIEICEFSTF
jgi:hypothetical protein